MARLCCPPFLWNIGRYFNHRISRSAAQSIGGHTIGSWASIRLLDRNILVDNSRRAARISRAYFTENRYQFLSNSPSPLVIDCGAHVGIGVLYWKTLYPGSRVIAFEPDPCIFQALKANCSELDDVTLHNAAIWTSSGSVRFSAVGSVWGHLTSLTGQREDVSEIDVPSFRLRDLLMEQVDLLKLDIEGAEVDVLVDCADRLGLVRNMFVEYHSFHDRPQRLYEVVRIIEEAGFRIHAYPAASPASRPFIERPVVNQKDFRLNIFACRVDADEITGSGKDRIS